MKRGAQPNKTKTAVDRPVTRTRSANYWSITRGPWYGFLFALPVLITYEVLIELYGRRVVNGADAILSNVLEPLFGAMGAGRFVALAAMLLVAGGFCWQAHRQRYGVSGSGGVRPGYFALMFVESAVYALFFGVAVNTILVNIVPGFMLQIGSGSGGPIFNFVMSLGAGIYEELVFRVILMGGLALALIRWLKWPVVWAWIAAALLSSLVFSAFHYLGAYGEVFALQSFLYRFVAGLLLATLFGLRGFGIAVWTHALYDVLVFAQGG